MSSLNLYGQSANIIEFDTYGLLLETAIVVPDSRYTINFISYRELNEVNHKFLTKKIAKFYT